MTSQRLRVGAYYAIWAAVCASLAGILVAVVHTVCFSANPDAATFLRTLGGDIATALALAAGQGAVAFAVAALLAAIGRGLRTTVLLGLVIALFDLGMYLLQMTVPATELGWGPDLAVLAAATALITAAGVAPAGVTASGG